VATLSVGVRPLLRVRKEARAAAAPVVPPSDAAKDPFSDAKANLRDTVKWLATTFAALAAVVVGSAPLAGLGALEITSLKFGSAILALLAGFLCICRALYVTLRILRPEPVYRSELLVEIADAKRVEEEDELRFLRSSIDAHARDLLPRNYPTLGDLAKASKQVDTQLADIPRPPVAIQDKVNLANGLKSRKSIDDAVISLLPLALYLRLQHRLDESIRPLFILGIAALMSLVLYGIAVHSDAPKQPGTAVVVLNDLKEPDKLQHSKLPVLGSVLFDTGKAIVSMSGVKAVEAARDALRDRPEAVLLVLAHTDTVAGRKVNESLAHRRAAAVVLLLTGTGGISPSRVYVAELPKLDLPEVTHPEQANELNRSVEMKLAVLNNAR
jgi:outer membrane protein OmpA-like peptidoglycan-associated protein